MAVPSLKEARDYRRCAYQRYEDAEILLRANHTTGAVYLAGYGVECMLKALILSAAPVGQAEEMLRSFRGPKAHSFNHLKDQYIARGGSRIPHELSRDFTLVDFWSTDLRYEPSNMERNEARKFTVAAGTIIRWAEGRL